jgi:hypothetical protein
MTLGQEVNVECAALKYSLFVSMVKVIANIDSMHLPVTTPLLGLR